MSCQAQRGKFIQIFILRKSAARPIRELKQVLIFEPEEDFPALYVIRDNP
jgi:hypothetical protein